MKIFKTLLAGWALALVFSFLPGLAHGYYRGGTSPHGHTSNTDGGVLTNPSFPGDITVAGQVFAETVGDSGTDLQGATLSIGSVFTVDALGSVGVVGDIGTLGNISTEDGNVSGTGTGIFGSLVVAGTVTLSGITKIIAFPNSATQSISSGTEKVVLYDDEDGDALGEWNGSTFTVTVPGRYSIVASVAWDASATGVRELYARSNNTFCYPNAEKTLAAASGLTYQTLSVVCDAAANSQITIRVAQTSGAALNLNRSVAMTATNFLSALAINRIP